MIPKALDTKAKTLMGVAFKAAIVAAPIIFAASPSHAAPGPLSMSWNSFTGAFDQANWTTVTTGSGGSVTGWGTNSLALSRSSNVTTTNPGNKPVLVYTIDPTLFEQAFEQSPSPATKRPVKFLYGSLSYDWAWNSTSLATATPTYNFSATYTLSIVPGSTRLSPNSTTTKTASGDESIGTLLAGDTFGFLHTKSNGAGGTGTSATGTISNFNFTAYYQEVPGPLPVAGAAAAFAWSRRLRRRLKTSQATV